jgi:SAM-dependent methyltransferase
VLRIPKDLKPPERSTVTLAPAASSARDALDAKYNPLLTEQLEFSKYVTYVHNKKQPVYGWFHFKEGFSARLVEELVTQEWLLPQGSLVFDPFAGCGTTLLTCQDLGYAAIGCDIMPISVFLTKVKLAHRSIDLSEARQAVDWLLSIPYSPTGLSWPRVKIVDLAFDETTRDKALFYRSCILEVENVAIRDFLMLGLLSSLEPASWTSKDGQFLRLVTRKPKPIEITLAESLGNMLTDLVREEFSAPVPALHTKAQMFQGDARGLPHDLSPYKGRVDAIVTSPPYLNRYDYSRTYALELCLMLDEAGAPVVEQFDDLKTIRHSLLRSHIESRPAPTDDVKSEALGEILSHLEPKALNNARIPIMIRGYFEDMNLAIGEMASMLRPGGRVALVVANARFEGEHVPVDLMLSEIASLHGLRTTEVRATRYKGNSSQQMGKYGRLPVRESIVFWEKTRSRRSLSA